MQTRLSRFILLVIWIPVACASAPKEVDPDRQALARLALAGQATKSDISTFLGAPPSACLGRPENSDMCQWEVGDQQTGWRVLARAIDTRDRINVICDVPTDGSPRSADSCGVYPRRSNRGSWMIHRTSDRKSRRSRGVGTEQRRQLFERADQIISEAATLVQLSHVMGSIPNSCAPVAPGEQVCLWLTSNHTFGHGTLAIWIEAPKRKRIRLLCKLPTGGGKRVSGSCSAVVGG